MDCYRGLQQYVGKKKEAWFQSPSAGSVFVLHSFLRTGISVIQKITPQSDPSAATSLQKGWPSVCSTTQQQRGSTQGMFPALSTAWLSTVKCWKFRRSSNSSRNDGIGPSTELTARRYFKSPPCVICVIPCAAPPGLLLPSWFRSKLLILPLAVFSHATTDTLADLSYYRQQTNETARQTCLQSSVVTGTLSGYHGKTRKWWTALCLPSKDIRSNKVTTGQLTAEQEISSESPALRTWQWWMSCQTSYKTNQVWN